MGAKGVDTAAGRVELHLEGPRRLVRGGRAARAEQHPHWPASTVRITLGGNRLSADGQRRSPSTRTSYSVDEPACEPFDDHERVVVAGHGERAGTVPEHLHGARRVGLDPDRRRRRPDVAKHRSEDQVGHVIIRLVCRAEPKRFMLPNAAIAG